MYKGYVGIKRKDVLPMAIGQYNGIKAMTLLIGHRGGFLLGEHENGSRINARTNFVLSFSSQCRLGSRREVSGISGIVDWIFSKQHVDRRHL